MLKQEMLNHQRAAGEWAKLHLKELSQVLVIFHHDGLLWHRQALGMAPSVTTWNKGFTGKHHQAYRSSSIEALRAARETAISSQEHVSHSLTFKSVQIKNKIKDNRKWQSLLFSFTACQSVKAKVYKGQPTFFWHLNISYYKRFFFFFSLSLLLLEHVILGELCSSCSPVQGRSAPLSWFLPPRNEEHGYQVACDSCCVRASRGPERRWHWQVPPCRIKGTPPFPVSLSVSLCISVVSDGVTLRGARWLWSRWMPCRISAWELHGVWCSCKYYQHWLMGLWAS